MSDEEIREQYFSWEQALRYADDDLDEAVATGVLRLILTIAHERAENKWHHEQNYNDVLRDELKALGWPEKELP